MLKIMAFAALLIVAVLAYAATKPDRFRIHRQAMVNAPPEKIFPLINDFHRWEAWSPYEKKDPAMKRPLQRAGSRSGRGV